MEAIKLSHYCRDCMYDRTQESKLKFFFIFQRAFTTSYPFATLWCISKKNKLLSCFNIQFSGGTRTFWKMCWLKARLEFDVKLGCDSRNWKFKFHFWSYMQDEVEVLNESKTNIRRDCAITWCQGYFPWQLFIQFLKFMAFLGKMFARMVWWNRLAKRCVLQFCRYGRNFLLISLFQKFSVLFGSNSKGKGTPNETVDKKALLAWDWSEKIVISRFLTLT